MSKTFKIVLVLLVVFSIASAVLAVIGFIGKEREYMKRLLVEDKLAATLKDKRRLEKELNLSKKLAEETEMQIAEMEAQVEKVSLQIEEEKDRSKTASLDLDAKKKELTALKEDLENEKKEKLAISKKLKGLEFDYDKAKKDISKLKNEKIRLEKDHSDLKEKSVDLDTIVVSPPEGVVSKNVIQAPKEKDLLSGRVLVVNKDYAFVVTDLGQDDGIEKGMVLELRDGSEFLGRAEVDKVYDSMSSASMLPGSNINNIKKGNLVIESR